MKSGIASVDEGVGVGAGARACSAKMCMKPLSRMGIGAKRTQLSSEQWSCVAVLLLLTEHG